MTLRKQVFSAMRWTAGVRTLSQVFTWVVTLAVIRLLTPGDYGLLAMATIFLGLMLTFSDAGIGPVLIQRAELGERTMKQVFGIVLVIHFSLAALLALSAPLIALFFNEARLVPVVRVLSLQLVMGAFVVIPDAVLARQLEFRKRSLLDLASTVTGSLTTLLLAWAGYGVWALVFGSLTTQALKVLGVNFVARCITWPEFSLKGIRSLIGVGGQTSASGLIWFFLVQADSFIAGKWLGKEALGIYSVAMHLASLPNQRIAGLINQVAFPAFSRMQHDVPKVAANTLLGVRSLSMIAFPVFWGISSVSPEIIKGLLGTKWIESIFPLQILSVVMPLRTITTFVPNAIQGVGRFDVILKNVIETFIVLVVAFVIGVQWGLVGLCIAWLISTPVIFLTTMRRNMAALRTPMRSLFVSMMRPAAAAFVMYCAVTACRVTFLADVSEISRLVVGILAGVVAYGAVTLILNRAGLSEMVALVRELAGPRSG